MRETGKAKTCVWRWQERFAVEGVDGLFRDKTRPSRIPKLARFDNYAIHKHSALRQWLACHPRWVFHFTPKSASWLNAIWGFFAILTRRRLKRGVFRSVVDLHAAINRFLKDHNAQAKPFQWVANPDEIIAGVRRGHQALDAIH